MRLNRILLSIVLVAAALIVQVSVLARLQLPGATPDLLLLVVLGLAMVYGHTAGALTGFFAGLVADLAPPADHAAGRYALVLCVIGYAAGLTKPEGGQHRSATVPMLTVAGGAIGSTLLYAGVGALVGDSAARHVGITSLLLTATLYDLLLAPFTVPLIMALARRTERDPLGDRASKAVAAASGARSYGWLSSGTGLSLGGKSSAGNKLFGKPGRGGPMRTARNGTGKAARLGIRRGSLTDASDAGKAAKLKGLGKSVGKVGKVGKGVKRP